MLNFRSISVSVVCVRQSPISPTRTVSRKLFFASVHFSVCVNAKHILQSIYLKDMKNCRHLASCSSLSLFCVALLILSFDYKPAPFADVDRRNNNKNLIHNLYEILFNQCGHKIHCCRFISLEKRLSECHFKYHKANCDKVPNGFVHINIIESKPHSSPTPYPHKMTKISHFLGTAHTHQPHKDGAHEAIAFRRKEFQ